MLVRTTQQPVSMADTVDHEANAGIPDTDNAGCSPAKRPDLTTDDAS